MMSFRRARHRAPVPCLYGLEIHLKYGENLPQLVVDLAGDADSFLLARRFHVRGELAQLLPRRQQFSFRLVPPLFGFFNPLTSMFAPRARTARPDSSRYTFARV